MINTQKITEIKVTHADGTSRVYRGKGGVTVYTTDIRNEKDSEMTVLEVAMKLDEEHPA